MWPACFGAAAPAGPVEEVDVHRLHVEIDAAIVAMLTVVESHSALLLRGSRMCPGVQPTGGQRACRGRAE